MSDLEATLKIEGPQNEGQSQHIATEEPIVLPFTPKGISGSDEISGGGTQQAMGTESSTSKDGPQARDQDESGVALTPALPQRLENSKKVQALTVESPNPPSALLWCPVKGRSHANLTEFGITFCSFCRQDLKPPEAIEAGQQRDRDREEESNDSASTSIPDESESDASQTKYSIRFLDDAGGHFSDQTWHESLDLERAREKLKHRTDPVVEVVSVISTSMSAEWSKLRAPPERERLIREGLLTDPNYAMELDHRLVVIRSENVIRAFQQIVTYWPGIRLFGTSITLREPYALFYHHRDQIKAFQKTFPGAKDDVAREDSILRQEPRPDSRTCDKETYQHLKALADAIESQNLDKVRKEIDRHRQRPAVTTHEMLWLLFKPGTTVYTKLDDRWAACVVQSCNYVKSLTARGDSFWELSLWYLYHNGFYLGRCSLPRSIDFFDGEKSVTDLPVFPAEYFDSEDGGALRLHLETRGERYFHLISGPQQVEYKGQDLDTGELYEGRAILDGLSYSGLVRKDEGEKSLRIPKLGLGIVYFENLGKRRRAATDTMQASSDSEPESGPHGGGDEGGRLNSMREPDPQIIWDELDYDYNDPTEIDTLDLINPITGEISKHRYLLCPAGVVGFMLKSRTWKRLDVECCSDIKYNTAAIDSVVMPEQRKMIIKSLVYRYTDIKVTKGKAPSSWTADLIQNKGEGQIFLLHGGPGVGKTFTAECIAESTGRPLLSLTCGDIGTSEAVAEERLSKWFRLAETWGAVMLLDEADVFLEKRATSDLERNSLVSIFLRMMEYYRGILFLTTNRVGHFDDAFVSRVHIVIEYQNLSESDRERIWTQFFNKLQNERGKYISISGRAKRYVLKDPEVTKIPWNGREIRNAFQTAVAFAEYRFAQTPEDQKDENEKACLEQEDFEKVCEMTGAFKKYLTAISGLDEASRAKLDQARNDRFRADRLER